ncbi:Ceramide-1-phosphate transfer protein, partial [Fragariocoptes setiger]
MLSTVAMSNGTIDCPSSINTTIPYDGELRGFDIDYAADQFQTAMSNRNAITLHHYLLGFRELLNLGPLFLFVTSDLETKIGLLEGYRRSDQGICDSAYLTIQSAIEYEREKDLLSVSDRPSAARTILRLHRALEFVSAFMLGISKLGEEEDTSSSAREAYSRTLAKHHGW